MEVAHSAKLAKKRDLTKAVCFGEKAALRKGAQKMIDMVATYFKKESNKPRGESEFVLNRAIETIGKVRFRMEFGGHELTNSHIMSFFEVWAKLSKQDALHMMGTWKPKGTIQRLMKQSKKLVEAVLRIQKFMKSQDRRTEKHIADLKDDIADFLEQWNVFYPEKAMFNKGHHVLVHVVPFSILYEMFGRVSAEGSENSHPDINKIKESLRSIPSDRKRIEIFLRRVLCRLDTKLQDSRSTMLEKTSRGRRGPYDLEAVSSDDICVSVDDLKERGDEFLDLPGGEGIIRKEWRETYEFLALNRVPVEWSEVFRSNAALSADAKIKAEDCN